MNQVSRGFTEIDCIFFYRVSADTRRSLMSIELLRPIVTSPFLPADIPYLQRLLAVVVVVVVVVGAVVVVVVDVSRIRYGARIETSYPEVVIP